MVVLTCGAISIDISLQKLCMRVKLFRSSCSFNTAIGNWKPDLNKFGLLARKLLNVWPCAAIGKPLKKGEMVKLLRVVNSILPTSIFKSYAISTSIKMAKISDSGVFRYYGAEFQDSP